VFTDKLVAKIPSSASGKIISINYGDDDICKVGHAIMTIEDGEGAEVVVETPVAAEPEVKSAEPMQQSAPVNTL
jgi:pyruvate/2-oxoglutarate dehydrogenase complex dihydrolipoamide acyltransferase (E2) component